MFPKVIIGSSYIPQDKVASTKGEYLVLVREYSLKYNVSRDLMVDLINCENRDWDASLQSRIIDKSGNREKSYGLSQIHLPSHPHITKEDATNPEFAIEFMAKEISKGKANKWSCYRIVR